MEFAPTAPAALHSITDAAGASIILILSDIPMPGMSGLELLSKAKAVRPGTVCLRSIHMRSMLTKEVWQYTVSALSTSTGEPLHISIAFFVAKTPTSLRCRGCREHFRANVTAEGLFMMLWTAFPPAREFQGAVRRRRRKSRRILHCSE
jgi:CheY-like chemotaxis protein